MAATPDILNEHGKQTRWEHEIGESVIFRDFQGPGDNNTSNTIHVFTTSFTAKGIRFTILSKEIIRFPVQPR